MFFRKPSPTPPLLLPSPPSPTFSKTKDTHPSTTRLLFQLTLLTSLFLASYFLFLHSPTTTTATCDVSTSAPFYIYNLPSHFNLGLLNHCQTLNIYTNMCPYLTNNGLGQPLEKTSWYSTHQFIAETIIHARLQNHPCRTWDPQNALLFYIPFYAGLYSSSVFRQQNLTLRDSLAVDLVNFLETQHFFKRNNGVDHFLTLGRTAWDFMRTESGPDFGANILLNLPPIKNMSVLTVERQPWNGANQNGIPYPSYFHPETLHEMLTWQNTVRLTKRPFLFSFVGGKRKGLGKAKIRDELVKQCGESTRCELVQCGERETKCYQPMEVVGVMMRSRFCLQAPGDSFTRRSTFDSVLAGCIPVFFSPHTAYTQYAWYLPAEKGAYSVYIDEKEAVGEGRIEEVLGRISSEEVEKMREMVVRMIPRVTYAHPNASNVGFEDAVDVLLQRLSKVVSRKIGRSFD